MKDEKPGGHGERSRRGRPDRRGAVGPRRQGADEPLWSLLAQRHGDAAGRRNDRDLCERRPLPRRSNDIGGLCDDVRRAIGQGHRRFKIKIGGASSPTICERIEAVLAVLERGMSLAVDGNGTFDREQTRSSISKRSRPIRSPGSRSRCIRSISICIATSRRDIAICRSRPARTCFRCDDARNLLRYAGLRQRSRHPAVRHLAQLRHRRISAHPRRSRRARLAAASVARRMPAICWR